MQKKVKRRVVRRQKSPVSIEEELVQYAVKFLKSHSEAITCLNHIKAFSESDKADMYIGASLKYILGQDESIFGRDTIVERLKNESNLRVACLLYMYTCKIVHRDYLSHSEFSMFRAILGVSFGEDSHHMVNDAKILTKMGAPINLLPNEYIVSLMQLDEFEKSISIILERQKNLRDLSEFESLDEAKEYYAIESGKIITDLNNQGMYGTHNVDLMALMLMGMNIGVSVNYPIYLVGDVAKDIKDEGTINNLKNGIEEAIKRSIKVIRAINEDDE